MNDTINEVGAGAPAAPVVQAEQEPADSAELQLRVARAIWGFRREDEDRCDMEVEDLGEHHSIWREANSVLMALQLNLASPPAHPDAALVDAADAALKAIQDTLEDAYHNAFPECCGQSHLECCGSPVQAWDERDQKIMDLLAPHEEALRAALAGKGGAQ